MSIRSCRTCAGMAVSGTRSGDYSLNYSHSSQTGRICLFLASFDHFCWALLLIFLALFLPFPSFFCLSLPLSSFTFSFIFLGFNFPFHSSGVHWSAALKNEGGKGENLGSFKKKNQEKLRDREALPGGIRETETRPQKFTGKAPNNHNRKHPGKAKYTKAPKGLGNSIQTSPPHDTKPEGGRELG